MRFHILSLLGLASASVATQWSGFESLPEGIYSGINHPDGSTTITSLDSGEIYDFSLSAAPTQQTRRSDYAISRRGTSCWGDDLDHQGVDRGVDALKLWAGNGRDLFSGSVPNYVGANVNGVYVYYCINQANSQGNLNTEDINVALQNMDQYCTPYEAGYYQWSGSVELVGKCRSGTAVCLGR
ncbi:hypothetical protein V492_04095 [Pseudogymnoascus sp. VKM F-4246]|nr:hypothetical protein V492_04095 [Pseudogymnoascus sp. VKM F-4246]